MATAKKKSAPKSAAPATGRPFQRGHDARRGHGPEKGAPNAGRPSNRIVEMAQLGLEAALPGIIAIAKGEQPPATEGAATNVKPGGEPLEPPPPVTLADRIRATETVGKVARMIGARIEVDHTQRKPTVIVLRDERRRGKAESE